MREQIGKYCLDLSKLIFALTGFLFTKQKK